MATLDDVRRIASRLPGATEGDGEQFGFSVQVKGKWKGFLWSWRERVDPKKPKVVNRDVLAILVPGEAAKQAILASDSDKYFTEPHYNGFPAVLVRLSAVDASELEDLVVEAWRCKASKELLEQLGP